MTESRHGQSGGADASLTFEALAERYNFKNTPDRGPLFVELLLRELEGRGRPRAALDIGCGQGIVRDPEKTRRVREVVDDFWGIEPDPSRTAA
jgi:hypothetical protein